MPGISLLVLLGTLAQEPAQPAPIRPLALIRPSASGAAAPRGEVVARAKLEMDPRAVTQDVHRQSLMISYPSLVKLAEERPEGVRVEPAYAGKVRYAVLRFGDAPDAAVTVAFDESDEEARLYIDADRDGDLTNDPKVAWDEQRDGEDGVSLMGVFEVPASWGEGEARTTGRYGVTILRRKGAEVASMFRAGARTGTLSLGDKEYVVTLADNAANALYDNAVARANKKNGAWLLIDLDGDGTFKPTEAGREVLDTSGPFPIGDGWYLAEFPVDGSELVLRKTEAPARVPQEPRNPLLQVGQKAPDFLMLRPDGTRARLADGSGKVRVIDFWATWCGPCLAAMPRVEALYQEVKGREDVSVLGLCVMDDRERFDAWLEKNREKYHFEFGFDPGNAFHKSAGISEAWGVYAIPTTFVIDRDDTIKLVLQGLGDKGEAELRRTLVELGIDLGSPGGDESDAR